MIKQNLSIILFAETFFFFINRIVQPLSDVSAHSLFLAAREGVFEFDKVQVFDRISHAIYNIQSSSKLRIYVTSQTLEEEKQKRKSEN